MTAGRSAVFWRRHRLPRSGARARCPALLRITTGARPVEAIATRCQAVLEALRGRTDAARTMLDVARRTLEDLGLGHGLLELELFAGLVELAAGDAAAAEAHLAVAYDGFHRLGIEADAAQAAALRARAALAVDDDERALTLAVTAEQLGGRDLKTAIAWRAVKAEVLARRGQHAEAIALARAATELADPTDALLDRADAQAALGAVLTIAGDVEGGRRATDQARSLYQQKGATALAARLGGTDALTDAQPPQVIAAIGETDDVNENFATRNFYAFTDAMARGEASQTTALSSFSFEDRRRGLGASLEGEAGLMVGNLPELADIQRHTLAVRGERLCLAWGRYEYVDTAFVNESLSLVGTDAEGRGEFTVVYDVTDSTNAIREIDERYAAGEGAAHTEILLVASRFGAALNARDWDAFDSVFAPDVVLVDHRRASFGTASGVTALIERSRSLAEVVPARRGRGAVIVAADLVRGRAGAGAPVRELRDRRPADRAGPLRGTRRRARRSPRERSHAARGGDAGRRELARSVARHPGNARRQAARRRRGAGGGPRRPARVGAGDYAR